MNVVVSVISVHRGALRQIIEKRIGLEMFTDKLSQVSKHEGYTKAAKKPQLNYQESSDVTFDYLFTTLFKGLESKFIANLVLTGED